jgi:hypothetical protein
MPWAILFIGLILVLLIEAAYGQFGYYGNISPLFRTAGLYPRDASIFFWAITCFGLFLALTDMLRAAWAKWATPFSEKWMRRYPFLRFMPETIAIATTLTLLLIMFLVPADHISSGQIMASEKNAGPIYEQVLFQVPHRYNFKPIKGVNSPPPEPIMMRTIHGKAIVTKIGPETYQIRMLQPSRLGGRRSS